VASRRWQRMRSKTRSPTCRGQNEKASHLQTQPVSRNFGSGDRKRLMPAGIAIPLGFLSTGQRVRASRTNCEASVDRVFGSCHLKARWLPSDFPQHFFHIILCVFGHFDMRVGSLTGACAMLVGDDRAWYPDRPVGGMLRLLASTSIDVEHQFSAFSDGTPPLFCQTPHIVDQSGQVILVDDYSLLFHAVLETGGIEAFVYRHVVQNPVAVLEPDCLVVSVFVFVAGRAHSGGKVVQQHDQLARRNEAGGMHIPYFLHWPKTLAHVFNLPFVSFVLWYSVDATSSAAASEDLRATASVGTGSQIDQAALMGAFWRGVS